MQSLTKPGCIALFYIVYVLAFEARKHSAHYGAEVKKAFLYCGSLTTFLWILYPIAWGLCEGGNVISPDSEAIFYSILDFLAKPCFGALLIWGHRNIDPASIGMAIRDYEDDSMVRREKPGVPTNSNIQAPLDGPAASNGHQV